MSFFQNLFNQEFLGNWVLGDRNHSLTFGIEANLNSRNYTFAFNEGPWDFSSGGALNLNYCLNDQVKIYNSISIDVTGSIPSSTTSLEVVEILNSDQDFSSFFSAEVKNNSVLLKSNYRFWVSNSGAEIKLGFNKVAKVAELPSYFSRHTIQNWSNFSDSTGLLLELDESDPIDQSIIQAAGLDPSQKKEDWELLRGRSGIFNFEKVTLDGSGRVSQKIEYPSGAQVGDLARKTTYSYSGANTTPVESMEFPYVLESGDLISP